jgi:hypothetical protein
MNPNEAVLQYRIDQTIGLLMECLGALRLCAAEYDLSGNREEADMKREESLILLQTIGILQHWWEE